MLTDDELRALADALEPHGWKQVAAHLRAQADAQPVAHYAMLDSHRRLVERAIQDAERPSGMSTHDGKARIDASVLRRMLAIIDAHPAPAVPAGWKWVPVEPTPEMIDAGCDVDARAEVVSKFAAKPGVHDPEAWVSAGELLSVQYRAMLTAAPAAPQAEPKRGLTCLWSHADDDTDMWETSCGHAFTIIDGTPSDNHMGFCCYCGRPLEQKIGGSDAE